MTQIESDAARDLMRLESHTFAAWQRAGMLPRGRKLRGEGNRCFYVRHEIETLRQAADAGATAEQMQRLCAELVRGRPDTVAALIEQAREQAEARRCAPMRTA